MKYFIFFSCAGCVFSFFTTPALAAVMKMDTDFTVLRVGDILVVDIVVDTENQVINAVETEVVFPPELFTYLASNEGDSVLNLFIEQPKLIEPGRINFSGITPGGFSSRDAAILSLRFKALRAGQGLVEISKPSLLVHDGLGTAALTTTQNLHLSVSEGASSVSKQLVDDEIPEEFTPEIIQDIDLFNNAHTLVFATEDKGSGLARFIVKEGYFHTDTNATSPYQLHY